MFLTHDALTGDSGPDRGEVEAETELMYKFDATARVSLETARLPRK